MYVALPFDCLVGGDVFFLDDDDDGDDNAGEADDDDDDDALVLIMSTVPLHGRIDALSPWVRRIGVPEIDADLA